MGSGLVKKRIARSGAGKRSGFRALVANRRGGPWFFIKGFAKNAMDDVDAGTRLLCAEMARELNAMNEASLLEAVANQELKELSCDAQEEERNGVGDAAVESCTPRMRRIR
ncbi:type II toxin-antitoxin system RelE/ParE family toxin [Roseateles sp. L2-2]|uniref:type II toxin-antitoxin system RelE/ParE family toxin n=1 Tax=Roseateles sp. L2-2 TaxID=3422597 RepID=UPI003D35E984